VSPLSVCIIPLVMVVAPLTPVSDAVQVLAALAAVNGAPLATSMSEMVALAVAVPVGPVVPWVLTWIWPEVNNDAVPPATSTFADGAEALIVGAPTDGRVTTGAGPAVSTPWLNKLALDE